MFSICKVLQTLVVKKALVYNGITPVYQGSFENGRIIIQ